MNTTTLFTQLSEIESKMEAPLTGMDSEALNDLDEKYEALWTEILSFQPRDAIASEQLLVALMDRLQSAGNDCGQCDRIKEKIRSLFGFDGMRLN